MGLGPSETRPQRLGCHLVRAGPYSPGSTLATRLRAALLVPGLLILTTIGSAAEWLKLESDHFDLFSNAGKRAAQRTAQDLERFHQVVEALQSGFEGAMPVRVVLFGSASDYNRFRWAKSRGKMAYYLSGRKHDYIVLHNSRFVQPILPALGRSVGSAVAHVVLRGRKQALFHEYVHLVQHQTAAGLPLWLEEGIAEVYSSIRTGGDKVRIGRRITGHTLTLQTQPLLDMPTLLSVDENSPDYRDTAKAKVFYAQSWALAHMLTLSESYAGGLDDFITALNRGQPQQEAFQGAFGRPIEASEKELDTYSRRFGFRETQISIAKTDPPEKAEPVPLSPQEAELLQIDLLLELGYVVDAEPKLRALVEGAHQAAVEVRLGELALRLLDYEQAQQWFARALEQGADGVRVHFGQAQALDETGGERQDVWRHLNKALDVEAGFPEALLFAGMLYNRDLRHAEAVAPLEKASEARPRWSPVWRALGMAYLHSRQPEKAVHAAGLALRTAQTPHQQQEAQRAFKIIQSRTPAESR